MCSLRMSLLFSCSEIVCLFVLLFIFFFKQKTAYEMRISDWSSDVCSSDLTIDFRIQSEKPGKLNSFVNHISHVRPVGVHQVIGPAEIGRASCRERVCQYV